MTKEDQIEEMAHAMKGCISYDCAECRKTHAYNGDLFNCFAEDYANRLYNAGYRKADEVRKETAREILNLVYQRVKDISGKSEYLLDDESIYEDSSFVNVLNNIGRKCGVEVEE